jgi:death on curing protein
MIEIEEVIHIQQRLIEEFGGMKGLRDFGLLDSALKRPFMTFGKTDLYQSVLDKACVLIHGIIQNHPFYDGNKRIGYFLFRAFLLSQGYDLKANEDEKYDLVIKIAQGDLSYPDILKWLNDHHDKK